jgi:hypothetical protein
MRSSCALASLATYPPCRLFVATRSFPMFDAFTKVVAQADARGEFINAGQIDALAAMVAESNKRMDASTAFEKPTWPSACLALPLLKAFAK